MQPGEITVVAYTGGPCGLKSTAIAHALQKMPQRGVPTFALPELATLLFTNGISPQQVLADKHINYQFQRWKVGEQLRREDSLKELLKLLGGGLLLIDRGAKDDEGYLEDPDLMFAILDSLHTSVPKVMNLRYDAVLHLQTSAYGAEEFFNLDNPARTEDLERARFLDDRMQQAWNGHEHFRFISNTDVHGRRIGLEAKLQRVEKELCRIVGIPEPLEIEKKFVPKKPITPQVLSDNVHVSILHISQDYLTPGPNREVRRVRRCAPVGHISALGAWFVYNEKLKVRSGVDIERERIIDYREYKELLTQKDPKRGTIIKDRHSFVWNGQYFQYDFFQNPQGRQLLEDELTEETDEVVLPPFLGEMIEVTDDPAWKNHTIALDAA